MKNKQIWIIPIMTMLILVLLATAFYPAYNPKPKEVPMAIVNLDTGTQVQGKKINIGQNIEKKMTESDQKTFNWTTLKDKDVATQKVQNGTYAGAIVIEKDFSAHAFSPAQSLIMKDKTQEMQEKVATGELPPQVIQQLQQQAPKPVKMSKAQINTYYNEGAQGQLGRVVKQALDQMTQGINTTISQQNRKALAQNHVSIPVDQLDAVIQPVKTLSKAYHPIKDNQANGNASMVYLCLYG
ncbi:YhgE/Pip domain-containing protein [Staphylococcus chromogenes]|uniref:YhgE/Pip domain-containing protein n=1 Tax=Staphylococcus chromogenes TaxID=46126 RepID=UPI0013002932|nr:ABC transporter permease [Staphylococcus chromogenes]